MIEAPHFRVQQAHRIALGVVRAKRVGAHQFRQAAGEMGLGAPPGAHFVEHHRGAGAGQLPGRLAAGEATADDVDRIVRGLIHGAPNVMPPAAKLKAERTRTGTISLKPVTPHITGASLSKRTSIRIVIWLMKCYRN